MDWPSAAVLIAMMVFGGFVLWVVLRPTKIVFHDRDHDREPRPALWHYERTEETTKRSRPVEGGADREEDR